MQHNTVILSNNSTKLLTLPLNKNPAWVAKYYVGIPDNKSQAAT